MEQNVIPFKIHKLPIEKIDSHALYVMEKLKYAGFVAYLVGGSVRDILLGHHPKDFDISTSAKPEEIKQLFRNCVLIGRRFRLAHIRFGKKVLEVSTFRAGDLENEELILRDNVWGYPEEDALRRDFTINGLFYDPSNQTVIDYVGGYEDLSKQLLRSIGQPYVRFKQDPVRMLRLLKFQARFGLEVDPDCLIALVECREEIVKSAPARVIEEVLRMLESGAAKNFIELMTEHGLLHHILPELAHFIEKEKEGQEIYAYLEEIDRMTKDTSKEPLNRSILLSALVYPLLQKRLEAQFLRRNQIPHLGQIQVQIRNLLTDLSQPFFPIPRRIKLSMLNILMDQYRLTPLHKKGSKKKRIPKGSDFLLALCFLELRTRLEPGLQKIFESWEETYHASGAITPSPPKQRKRPRRRKKPRGQN